MVLRDQHIWSYRSIWSNRCCVRDERKSRILRFSPRIRNRNFCTFLSKWSHNSNRIDNCPNVPCFEGDTYISLCSVCPELRFSFDCRNMKLSTFICITVTLNRFKQWNFIIGVLIPHCVCRRNRCCDICVVVFFRASADHCFICILEKHRIRSSIVITEHHWIAIIPYGCRRLFRLFRLRQCFLRC